MKPKVLTVEDYFADLPKHIRLEMEKLRQAIRKAAPQAIEIISYQMPAYKLNGRFLVSFAVWKNHVGLYPVPAGDAAFRKEVQLYKGAKSTLRIPIDKPFPLQLIRKTVKFRMKEELERQKQRKT